MKGDIITFTLIFNLAFRFMGVFFVKTKRRTSFIVPTNRGASDGSAHPRDVQLNLENTDVNNANTDGYISATGI